MSKEAELISAQVILSAASVTDPAVVMNEFAVAGFVVGPLYANNFSITAPAEKFETYFHVSLESSLKEGIRVESKGEPAGSTLPLAALPAGIKDGVEAILFTKPPDFGPGGNY